MASSYALTRRMTSCILAFLTIYAAACTGAPAPAGERAAAGQADSATTAAELVRLTQSLLDAVASGDTALWARHLAEDGLFTDENGNTATKRKLLANMHPLPPGFSGHIVVANPRVRVAGDADGSVAIISYDANEDETVFGQALHTRYHQTDSYIRRGGRWVMLASQTQVLPSEHTAVAIDPATLDAYAGTYRLAPTVEYVVTRNGARLLGKRAGRPPEELFPLGADRFFRRGAPRGEKIFERDSTGRVSSMIDRRDNNDLIWRRVR